MQIEREWSGRAVAAAFTRCAAAAGACAPLATATNMRLPPAAAKVTHRESINIPGRGPGVGRLIHNAAAESSILPSCLQVEVLNFEGGFLNFFNQVLFSSILWEIIETVSEVLNTFFCRGTRKRVTAG